MIQSTTTVSEARHASETHPMASPGLSKNRKQKTENTREWIMRRAPTLPSDLIVVSFMVLCWGIVLRDEEDTDRDNGWESPSE